MSEPISESGKAFEQDQQDQTVKDLLKAWEEGDVEAADEAVQKRTKQIRRRQGKD